MPYIKNRTPILTDCDGVLLNFGIGFPEYINNAYPDLKIDLDAWDFGLPKEQFWDLISDFNTTPDFGKMPPLRDSVEYVEKLVRLGYRFVAISTCLGNDYTRILREHNLKNIYGDIF